MVLSLLAPLAALDRVALVSLQKGPAGGQVGGYFGPAPLINLAPEINDFVDTAAIIDALDLVVTVDTSVAHLAGAMAKPACVLLPFAPDWRWLRDRHDSPWYPSLRLFRQTRPGDWSDAVASLAQYVGKH
jgi:ADP-heptose:LPS heptosyltransferase